MSNYNFRGITRSNHKPAVAACFRPRYHIQRQPAGLCRCVGGEHLFPNRAAAEVRFPNRHPADLRQARRRCRRLAILVSARSCVADGNIPLNDNIIKADPSSLEVYRTATCWSPSVLNSGAEGRQRRPGGIYPAEPPHDIGWFASADVGRWFLETSESRDGSIPLKSYTSWDLSVAFTWKQFTIDLRCYGTDLSKADCNACASDQTATVVNGVGQSNGAAQHSSPVCRST
jgi:hypothetical protein